jgi:hypothetical protein
MAGARRCLYFAGTLAVAVLAALVPTTVAAASGRDPAVPNQDQRGADSDPAGPSNTNSDPGTSGSSTTDPAQPAPPTAAPPPAPRTTAPADPAGPVDPPGPVPSRSPRGGPVGAPGPELPATRAGTDAPASPVDPPKRPAVVPHPVPAPSKPPPASVARAEQTTSPGAGWADVRGVGRGPDPGSLPRPVAAKPQAEDVSNADDPWSFLRGPEAGAHLFLAGFVALLVSIGGLVAVGIRRHRW